MSGEALDFGQGYVPPNIVIYEDNSSPVDSIVTDCPYGYGVYYEKKKTWSPPTPYIPGQPYRPPTPTQIRYLNNSGWNSWARSVEKFVKGKFYDFNCATGIEGCCIGIGTTNALTQNISQFSHALIIDQKGVQVQESGEIIATLKSAQSAVSNIRVYRRQDNHLVYVVTTGSEVVVHTSAAPYPYPMAYIYGYLYSTGDEILSSSYIEGAVHYGSV